MKTRAGVRMCLLQYEGAFRKAIKRDLIGAIIPPLYIPLDALDMTSLEGHVQKNRRGSDAISAR